MDQLDVQFSKACREVEDLYTRLDNTTIKKIYAYFKQATEGDVSGKRPSVLKLRDRVKFDSWSSISGMSMDDAKIAYVSMVKNLQVENDAISCEDREPLLRTE